MFLSCTAERLMDQLVHLPSGVWTDVHTGGLQHALAIAHVLERHGELLQVDLVTDPLVLLTRCIFRVDNLGRMHGIVFYGMNIRGLYLHSAWHRAVRQRWAPPGTMADRGCHSW